MADWNKEYLKLKAKELEKKLHLEQQKKKKYLRIKPGKSLKDTWIFTKE